MNYYDEIRQKAHKIAPINPRSNNLVIIFDFIGISSSEIFLMKMADTWEDNNFNGRFSEALRNDFFVASTRENWKD